MKKLYIIVALLATLSLNAQALFEIKDASDNAVFEIANDGLRVFNLGDTMLVISTSEAKIDLSNSKDKALSRSFSVTTSSSKKSGLIDVLEVTTDNTIMREGGLGDQYTNFSPDNLFLGLKAGQNNVSGINNIFIGNESGTLNYYGDDNIYIGYQAGYRNDYASENVFIGNYAGYNNYSDDPPPYGSMNAFVGTYAGYSHIDGFLNTFLGYRAGEDNRGARENTYVGGYAGSNNNASENVAIGVSAGNSNLTGSGNVFLGYKAGFSEMGSDKLYIDNSNTTTPLIHGDFATDILTVNGTLKVGTIELKDLGSTSLGIDGDIIQYSTTSVYDLGNNVAGEYWDDVVGDDFINHAKFDSKSEIKNVDSGLGKILKLRPITYKSDRKRFDLIPAEVEKIIPEAVISQDIDVDHKTGQLIVTEVEKGMVYNQLIPVLIKSIQEQQEIIEKLEIRIVELENK